MLKFHNTSYGKIAKLYHFLDVLNVGHVARRSRNHFLHKLPFVPQNPLVVGCGTGDFALALAQTYAPPRLSINDVSKEMIEMTKQRLKQLPWSGTVTDHCCDITSLVQPDLYDYLSLNYILNLFSPIPRTNFLKSVVRLLAPSGVLQVADFAVPANPLMKPLSLSNWALANIFFWLFSSTKPNRLGNMEDQFRDADLEIITKKTFLGGLYAAWLLRKGPN